MLLGMLAVAARTEMTLLSRDESAVLDKMINRIARALSDRRLQQAVFVQLRRIIPDIDRIQQLRGLTPYSAADSAVGNDEQLAAAMLNPSPIHSPEFEDWVERSASPLLGRPKTDTQPSDPTAYRRREAGPRRGRSDQGAALGAP